MYICIYVYITELLPVLFSNCSHLRSCHQVKMLAVFCKFLIMFKNFDGKKQSHYRSVIEIWQLLEFS